MQSTTPHDANFRCKLHSHHIKKKFNQKTDNQQRNSFAKWHDSLPHITNFAIQEAGKIAFILWHFNAKIFFALHTLRLFVSKGYRIWRVRIISNTFLGGDISQANFSARTKCRIWKSEFNFRHICKENLHIPACKLQSSRRL